MRDARGIAVVGKAPRQPVSDAQPTLGHRKQHDAAVRRDTPAVKGDGDFLAASRWKQEREEIIAGHGGRGCREGTNGISVSNHILRQINALRYAYQPQNQGLMNKAA